MTFRTGVEYVTIDAVVTGKDGNAVTDLVAGDFEIVEGGRAQTIRDFQFVSVPPSHRTIGQAKTVLVPWDVVTNARSSSARSFVLVIDDLHIIAPHIFYLRRVVGDFLDALSPDDQLAFVFTGRSDLSQDFTNDPARQALILNRLRNALGFAANPGSSDPLRRQYSLGTIEVLTNVSRSLAESNLARRAIVYVSEGLDFDFSTQLDVFPEMRALFAAARQSGVSIYTIDPRGPVTPETALKNSFDLDPAVSSESRRPNRIGPAIRRQVQDAIRYQASFMRSLAENTGGLAQVNRSDQRGGINEILADNSSYYVLGYSPEPLVRDGKFHPVDLKVKRSNVHVRWRHGYTASPPTLPVGGTKGDLDRLLTAALPVSGLEVRAYAAPLAAAPSHKTRTLVTVEVVYPWTANSRADIDDELLLRVMALDHEAKTHALSEHAFHLTSSRSRAGGTVVTLDDALDLPDGPIILRVGVASRALEKAGTVHLSVDIPSLSSGRLSVPAVVIGLPFGEAHASLGASALTGLAPFQPTTKREFARSDILEIYTPIVGVGRQTSATVSLAINRAEEVVFTRTVVVAAAMAGTNPHGEFRTNVPLKDLTPGTYTVTVEARTPDGRRATRAVAFEIK